jgi:thymidylate synthase (FAD)
MSASLQYSDYSDDAAFAIPYEVMERGEEETYLTSCKLNMANYAEAVRQGLDNDAAGYMAPQGLRNVLIISATPYQWKHIIGQRTCRRNTSETRLVLLTVWDELYKLNPLLFSRATTGPFCMRGACKEGKMGCKNPMPYLTPSELLWLDYPLLFREEGATDAG